MSSRHHRVNKRRRQNHQPHHLGYHASTSNEERLLHQAIQNSKLGGPTTSKIDVPWGPTFFPTVDDMNGSPLDYIDKIRPVAQRYGICKIVPPEGWKQRDFFGKIGYDRVRNVARTTRTQSTDRLSLFFKFFSSLVFYLD
jgi:histone demethylase JARID1